FVWMSLPPASMWDVAVQHYQQFPSIGHLPLGAMLQNGYLHLVGGTPDALQHAPLIQRVPAVIWGSLAIPALMMAIRRLVSAPVARITGLLYAGLFFPVFYSREAYYYAPLMLFACLALLGLAGVMTTERKRGLWLALWLVSLAAATLTHITGVLLCLGHGAGLALAPLLCRSGEKSISTQARHWARLSPLVLISALPLVPFLAIRMAHPGQQGVSGAPAFWMVLYDMIGKQFLGVSPVAGVAGVVLFIVGLIALVRANERSRAIAVAMGVVILATLLGSLSTQYSSRYFTAASPGVVLIFATGLQWIGERLAGNRPAWRDRMGLVLAGAVVSLQLGLFHLPAYQLEAKARNYGGMARWLIAHMPPGTPYLLESAYDIRFLGQYHQTPGLIPATPYTHGPGPAEMEKLRTIQQNFMLQFPEAPFVEAARHGTEFNAQVPVWTWPHEHFRERADLWNKPLERLVKRGIWPQIHAAGMPDIEYHTVIWYNTPADNLQIALEQGEGVTTRYPAPWSVAQVAQGVYMRVHPPGQARIELNNLTGESLSGRLVVEGAMASRNAVPVEYRIDGTPLSRDTFSPGSTRISSTAEFSLSPGSHELSLSTPSGMDQRIQAMLIKQIRFEPSPPN
ncbi:MAG: glycosyltransferase family 39 protein, partial [Kiritimatiellae bacterium]|nr:glycosyltransferase family 39 protein [Kiritimatiellia bacterium]